MWLQEGISGTGGLRIGLNDLDFSRKKQENPFEHSEKGLRYLDGGLTNQQPTFDSATIKISPFSGKYKDICPSETSRANITLANENMYINFNNFIRGKHAISHLDDKTLSYYYQLGYNITKKFLENNQN